MSTLTEPITNTSHYTGFDLQFIAGEWRRGRSERANKDIDPYTGRTLVEIPQASAEDLDDAYRTAAKVQPEWARRPPGERGRVLTRVAQLMEARRKEIITWLIREAGSTRLKANLEWSSVHAVALEAASLPYSVEGRIMPADLPGKESRVYRNPVGVVGVISPWNWPLQLTARSVFPALAVGNGVVVKPASDTPITGGSIFAKLLEEAGLPPGLFSVVIGAGSEIGDGFVSHPVSRVISFTGSTPVGRRIGRLAMEAPIIKRLELELGGNSPLVILADADIDHAAEAAVFGKFLHQGQICMIANRLIVERSVARRFTDAFVSRSRALRAGDPNDPETMIGPIINRSQLEGLQAKIEEARESGLREMLSGKVDGQVLPPHIFHDVPNDHPLAREEIFGPIAPIVIADDAEHALKLANATRYGLSSAVFTGDVERGLAFARRMEAGMTHVNDQPVNDLPFSPFGGEKNSGIGRFNGVWAVAAFTSDHWVTVQHQPREYPLDARALEGPWAGG